MSKYHAREPSWDLQQKEKGSNNIQSPNRRIWNGIQKLLKKGERERLLTDVCKLQVR